MVSQANQKTGNPKTNRMKVVFRSKPYSPWRPPEKWSGPTLSSLGSSSRTGADDLREIEQNAKYERIPWLEEPVECNFEPKWFQKFMKCDIFTLLSRAAAISVPNEGGKFNRWSITSVSSVQETTIGIFSKNKNKLRHIMACRSLCLLAPQHSFKWE